MKYPKIRELGEAIKSLLSRPYTTKFPKVPSIPPKGFKGKSEYYEKECVGCKACYEVCPARAITVEDTIEGKRGKRKLTVHHDICIFCGQCEAACITKEGIRLTLEYDLAGYDRTIINSVSEKELVICEGCGEIVGAMDHLKYLAKKIGSMAYSNPSLFLAQQQEQGLLDELPEGDLPHKRADNMRFLCPQCRRGRFIKEEWI